MNPFYDENYFNYPMYNPRGFTTPYPYMPQRVAPFRRLGANIDLKRTLNTATKTIYTVNQVIPLIYQVAPIVNNARNAFRVIKAVNTMNRVDLDEIDREVTVDEEEVVETKEATVDDEVVQPNDIKDEELFENMV